MEHPNFRSQDKSRQVIKAYLAIHNNIIASGYQSELKSRVTGPIVAWSKR